jgi:TRAP-type C4-dicarboxylate transport system permease large subunit
MASAALLNASADPIIILLLINLLILMAGTFLDMTPAGLIFTPIFLPAVIGLGVDPVHFGILLIMNLCIGLCTPPVGACLFVGCGVGRTSIARVVAPLLSFLAAMIVVLLVTTYWSPLTLWLPRAFGLMD